MELRQQLTAAKGINAGLEEHFNTAYLNIETKASERLRKAILNAKRLESAQLGKDLYNSLYKEVAAIQFTKVREKCGIYRITNLRSGKVYIGQAKDVFDRWLQHIQAGLGVTGNFSLSLYKDMIKFGPEAFSYTLLEECTREMLNDRERF